MNISELCGKAGDPVSLKLFDGSEIRIVKNASEKGFASVCASAKENGYGLIGSLTEGSVSYETLRSGDETLFASYSAKEARVALVSRKNAYVCEAPSPPEKICAPLLTQLRMGNFNFDCGMGYVIRTCEGKFVIIDGGAGKFEFSEETEHLIEVVKKQNVTGKKPVISAWILTHAHDDHFGVLAEYAEKYRDEFEVESVIWNLPDPKLCPVQHGMSFLGNLTSATDLMKNTRFIVPSSGQRFVFGDAVFDILLTPEDFYPDRIDNFNSSSIVSRMTLGNYRVLWLGDAVRQAADKLCLRYGKDTLKCDLLQVGHHGFGGGSTELYSTADPSALLWPCSDFVFHSVKNWESNTFLMTSPDIKTNYLSGRQEVTLDMTLPLPEFKPYPELKKGDVLFKTDFQNTDLLGLGLNCLTGGSFKYTYPVPVLKNGRLRLKRIGRRPAALEIVQQTRSETLDFFRLTIKGRPSFFGKLGVMFDNGEPSKYDPNRIIRLPSRFRKFEYVLEYDAKNGTATLYKNGKKIKTKPSGCPNGIYLILKNTFVTLESISVTV